MEELLEKYLSSFIIRYDKDGIIPYCNVNDFEGLNCCEKSFTNTKGIEIHYFLYNYDSYDDTKIVLFLPGIGPGHTAYLTEINKLALNGYQVLTLDYTGCGASKGENIISLYEPTIDALDLLNLLALDKRIIVIGHSLGGFTALNILNKRRDIKKGVLLAPIVTLKNQIKAFTNYSTDISNILEYEEQNSDGNASLSNITYLANTSEDILFIHSKDDPIVPFNTSTGYVKDNLKNKFLRFIVVDGKGHNPNYTLECAKELTELNAKYLNASLEEKKKLMENKDPKLMTLQDEIIWESIFNFIK